MARCSPSIEILLGFDDCRRAASFFGAGAGAGVAACAAATTAASPLGAMKNQTKELVNNLLY
jgi:hypothetical protein